MSDIGPLSGLAFFALALATASLGGVGLLVQWVAVAVLRLTRKERSFGVWDDLALASLGPLACGALGGIAMLLVSEMGRERALLDTLDTLSPVLPVLGIALWVAIQIALVLWRRRQRARRTTASGR